jgi:hypothetical protein
MQPTDSRPCARTCASFAWAAPIRLENRLRAAAETLKQAYDADAIAEWFMDTERDGVDVKSIWCAALLDSRERDPLAMVAALKADMPCGHPQACVSAADEGTAYCRWCEDVGRLKADRRMLVERVFQQTLEAVRCRAPMCDGEPSWSRDEILNRVLAAHDAKGAPSLTHGR